MHILVAQHSPSARVLQQMLTNLPQTFHRLSTAQFGCKPMRDNGLHPFLTDFDSSTIFSVDDRVTVIILGFQVTERQAASHSDACEHSSFGLMTSLD